MQSYRFGLQSQYESVYGDNKKIYLGSHFHTCRTHVNSYDGYLHKYLNELKILNLNAMINFYFVSILIFPNKINNKKEKFIIF